MFLSAQGTLRRVAPQDVPALHRDPGIYLQAFLRSSYLFSVDPAARTIAESILSVRYPLLLFLLFMFLIIFILFLGFLSYLLFSPGCEDVRRAGCP